MARTGRPRKEIDKESVEKLCRLLCTKEEVAGFFDCSISTIERFCKNAYKDENGEGQTFETVLKKFGSNAKISLRRLAFKHAEKSYQMTIFLCKQYLGMSDNPERKDAEEAQDDGFYEALNGTAAKDWASDEDETASDI